MLLEFKSSGRLSRKRKKRSVIRHTAFKSTTVKLVLLLEIKCSSGFRHWSSSTSVHLSLLGSKHKLTIHEPGQKGKLTLTAFLICIFFLLEGLINLSHYFISFYTKEKKKTQLSCFKFQTEKYFYTVSCILLKWNYYVLLYFTGHKLTTKTPCDSLCPCECRALLHN